MKLFIAGLVAATLLCILSTVDARSPVKSRNDVESNRRSRVIMPKRVVRNNTLIVDPPIPPHVVYEPRSPHVHHEPRKATKYNIYLAPGTSEVFQSEFYPHFNYPKKKKYIWTFTTDSDATLSIVCDDFVLQGGNKCKDFFQVIDKENGYKEKFCGVHQSLTIDQGTSKLKIVFKTNKKQEYKGFSCNATASYPVTTVAPVPLSDCGCGVHNPTKRIVNGTETDVNEYPWMAMIRPNWLCGASIISDQWILTAAHCADGLSYGYSNSDYNNYILVGEHDMWNENETDATQRFEIAEVIIHPQYATIMGIDHDVALIRLTTTITFTARVGPVCLPTAGESYSGVLATVTGWGTTSSGGSISATLLEVDVPIMSNEECYGDDTYYTPGEITDDMICAGLVEGGIDACQGDSGGPLVYDDNGNYVLIGVVSWGYGCASPGYPGVYARVTYFLDWINSYISGSDSCPLL